MTSNHEVIEEVIAAYALDAMPSGERAAALPDLLDHLSGCNACRATYNDFRDTAGDLALGTPAVAISAALEDRVMAAVRGEAQTPVARPSRPRWIVRSMLAASFAALLAMGAVSLTTVASLRDERANARRSTQALAVLADPGAQRTLLAADGVTGVVSLAVAADGRAVLIGSGLPSIPSGRVFELWLMRKGTPVPAGIFTADGGSALLLLDADARGFDAAAITVEPGPAGTKAPTSDVIYSAPLPV